MGPAIGVSRPPQSAKKGLPPNETSQPWLEPTTSHPGEEEVMGKGQEIDVEQIMAQIRENIRRRRTAGERPVPENRSSPFDDGHAAADFARLHSDYNIQNVSIVSNRR